MKGRGGTVNGRTLQQVMEEHRRVARMERENYAWKKGRPTRMDPARFTLDLDDFEAVNVVEALTFALGGPVARYDIELDHDALRAVRAARDQLREQLTAHAR